MGRAENIKNYLRVKDLETVDKSREEEEEDGKSKYPFFNANGVGKMIVIFICYYPRSSLYVCPDA